MEFKTKTQVVGVHTKDINDEVVIKELVNGSVNDYNQMIGKAHFLVNEGITYTVFIRREVSDPRGNVIKSEVVYYMYEGENMLVYHNQIINCEHERR